MTQQPCDQIGSASFSIPKDLMSRLARHRDVQHASRRRILLHAEHKCIEVARRIALGKQNTYPQITPITQINLRNRRNLWMVT
jgi:hypothetical protein